MLFHIKLLFELKEKHSSKQVNILILKTILFNSQNVFQSTHTSSLVAKSIIKTVDILNLSISDKFYNINKN